MVMQITDGDVGWSSVASLTLRCLAASYSLSLGTVTGRKLARSQNLRSVFAEWMMLNL